MASLPFLYAIDQRIITRQSNKSVIIIYGISRAGNDEFVYTINENAEVIYRVANNKDPVPQVPLFNN